jgi:hypothetical protein
MRISLDGTTHRGNLAIYCRAFSDRGQKTPLAGMQDDQLTTANRKTGIVPLSVVGFPFFIDGEFHA